MSGLLAGLFFCLGLSNFAFSETHLGLEAATSQDKKTISSSSTLSNIFLDGSALVSFTMDSNYFLTLGYIYSTSSEPLTTSTSATFISSNPYGGLSYFTGKKHVYGLGVYWIPFTQGSYAQTGTSNETWSGSGYYAKVMIQPALTTNLSISFSLIYFSASYTSKGSASSVSDVSSFTRTYYSPLVGLKLSF